MKPYVLILAAIAPVALLAQQSPNFSGTWLSNSDTSQKWIFTQKDDKIQVRELNGDKVEADFTCRLDGNDCAVKENSHSEKIMMYFNGEKLVEIRQRGDDAIKQRLTLSADGKTLTVETVPLSSSQKANKVIFRREDTTVS